MIIKLENKYARICRKCGGRLFLVDYSNSDDSDGEDLEAYEGFADSLTVINVETTEGL